MQRRCGRHRLRYGYLFLCMRACVRACGVTTLARARRHARDRAETWPAFGRHGAGRVDGWGSDDAYPSRYPSRDSGTPVPGKGRRRGVGLHGALALSGLRILIRPKAASAVSDVPRRSARRQSTLPVAGLRTASRSVARCRRAAAGPRRAAGTAPVPTAPAPLRVAARSAADELEGGVAIARIEPLAVGFHGPGIWSVWAAGRRQPVSSVTLCNS
jgi:hypothetical protein